MCEFNGVGERFRHKPWGLFGGESGANGRFFLQDDAGSKQLLPSKATGVSLNPNQLVVMETPGAGGYGLPADRPNTSVKEDLDSGKFSLAFVEKNYKV